MEDVGLLNRGTDGILYRGRILRNIFSHTLVNGGCTRTTTSLMPGANREHHLLSFWFNHFVLIHVQYLLQLPSHGQNIIVPTLPLSATATTSVSRPLKSTNGHAPLSIRQRRCHAVSFVIFWGDVKRETVNLESGDKFSNLCRSFSLIVLF